MSFRVRESLALLPLAAAVFVLATCSSEPSGQGNGCASTGADVTINAQSNFTFDKPTLTITLGQRVCWQTADATVHNVTSDPASPSDSLWNLDAQLSSNTVAIHTFTKSGDYPYHCFFHQAQNMHGTIHVP